jgi:hypothetical protein
MVFFGFIAAWFFADSPIKRSLSVKDTNEGVVKEPKIHHVSNTVVFKAVKPKFRMPLCKFVWLS